MRRFGRGHAEGEGGGGGRRAAVSWWVWADDEVNVNVSHKYHLHAFPITAKCFKSLYKILNITGRPRCDARCATAPCGH